MASLKFALAAVALSAVVINSVVADEAAQAANLDGGYPKFPSRFRRQASVPSLSSSSGGFPGSSSLQNYQNNIPTGIPQMPSGMPSGIPTGMPTGMPTIPSGGSGYGQMMKPEYWQGQAGTYTSVQKPNNGKPNDNGNRPEAPQTEIGDDDETKCS